MNLSDLVERYFEEVQSTPSVQNDELERTLVAAGADVPTACRIIMLRPSLPRECGIGVLP